MPGITVLTSGFERMKRRAISGIVIPAGTSGLSASAWATDALRFSGTKYVLRQSSAGQVESSVSVPVRLPSSSGTRAMTATPFSRQAGKSSSSGAWSKML